MASEMETSEIMTQSKTTTFPLRIEKKLQKRLRNSGLEYVSRSGKIIPAKRQPEVLCQCPQRCGDKIPFDVRRKLFTEFYKLGDHALQNEFLMAHIQTRAVQRKSKDHKTPVRNQRRVSCKYHVPLLPVAAPSTGSSVNSTQQQQQQQQQKEEQQKVHTVEVCQKAFMNVYAITEKRVRLQREKLICHYGIDLKTRPTCPSDTPQQRPKAQKQMRTPRQADDQPIDLRRKRGPPPMIPIPLLMKAPDKDIAIVHNFFQNQLWKPEYIGTAT